MKNGILERWGEVMARKGREMAVRSASGGSGDLGGAGRTFLELDAESEEVAKSLTHLPAGSVVSLQAPNVLLWPALLLGIWKAGACALLVDPTLSETSRGEAEHLCGARLRLGAGERPILTDLPYPPVDFGSRQPDLIKLTSGTTGAPRAILFTAAKLEADGRQICETMGIGGRDLNYGVVAFSHSYGFSNLIVPLLCEGVPLVAARDMLPRAVSAGVAASGATVLPGVPALFQALAGLKGGEGEMPVLRLCISAGAPLRPETGRAFRERFGRKVHTFYGASECGGICYDGSDDDIDQAGFVGRPMRGVRIEPREGGRILVRSDAVGLGAFPEIAGDDSLSPEGFLPADLLAQDESGWRIEGRSGDLINVGGKKVSPGEIERVLLSHPAVRDAVVFGVANGARTEAVCACVVGEGEMDAAALRRHCAGSLAAWQVPRTIVQLDAIPVNGRGKVSRAELARRFGAA